MSQQQTPVPPEGTSTQKRILEDDNLTLAITCANTSLHNAVRLRHPPSHTGSPFEQHTFNLVTAYNEFDILTKSLGVSHEVAAHAKSLYSQVYNFSGLEDGRFQHEILIAGCGYIACYEKDQGRSMLEVFESSRATVPQMVSVYRALATFFAVPVRTRSVQSEGDGRLQAGYEEIGKLSRSISIPLYAMQHVKRLYKKTHNAGSFRDEDRKVVIVAYLLIACRQLHFPQTVSEILALDPGATKVYLGRAFKSLGMFFTAESKRHVTETRQPGDTARSTTADARSNDRIIRTLRELTEQLHLDGEPLLSGRRNAVFRANFAFTASTAPTAPTIPPEAPATNRTHAHHDSTNDTRSGPFHPP